MEAQKEKTVRSINYTFKVNTTSIEDVEKLKKTTKETKRRFRNIPTISIETNNNTSSVTVVFLKEPRENTLTEIANSIVNFRNFS